jgi:hypothetical protein
VDCDFDWDGEIGKICQCKPMNVNRAGTSKNHNRVGDVSRIKDMIVVEVPKRQLVQKILEGVQLGGLNRLHQSIARISPQKPSARELRLRGEAIRRWMLPSSSSRLRSAEMPSNYLSA